MNVIKVPISQLVNDPNNARKHGTKNISAIKGSLAKFGQQKPIVIDAKNVVIAGNGTLEAAKQLGWTHINAVVTELDDLGKMAFALADNKTSELAEWDDPILAEQLDWLDKQDFDIDSIGFEGFELPKDSATEDEKEDLYTKKIKAPIYEITGEKPKVDDLYDGTKTNQLIQQILDADIPENEKNFLKLAAQRHTVFSYEKIAEYYAHAPKQVQELMESSALVIIDFNKAIENGFVTMAKEIAEAYTTNEDE